MQKTYLIALAASLSYQTIVEASHVRFIPEYHVPEEVIATVTVAQGIFVPVLSGVCVTGSFGSVLASGNDQLPTLKTFLRSAPLCR